MENKRMSKTKQEREDTVTALKKEFAEVEGGVLTDYRGLKVKEITDLRRQFRQAGISYKVVKNTLTQRAIQDTDYQDLTSMLAGPTGVAFSADNAINAARIAVEFARDHKALSVKGGFMEGAVLSLDMVREIAKLTGKDQLKSEFLSVLNGPSQKLLGVLLGVPQKLLGVLKAREEQLETN